MFLVAESHHPFAGVEREIKPLMEHQPYSAGFWISARLGIPFEITYKRAKVTYGCCQF